MLLEVLIAFSLVVLCVFPLISPHVFMWKAQRHFVDTVELDRIVNVVYGEILEELYNNRISWLDIEDGREIPIEEKLLKNLPFRGTYHFNPKPKKEKSNKEEGRYLYLLELQLTLTPKEKGEPIDYKYDVLIERLVPTAAAAPGEISHA